MTKLKNLLTGAALGAAAWLGAAQAAEAPPGTDWSKAQTIDIAMSDFSFAPANLQLRANQPYRLHLTNSSSHGHNFAAPTLFAAAAVAPNDQSKVEDGSIEVAGGQTIDVTDGLGRVQARGGEISEIRAAAASYLSSMRVNVGI